MNGLVKGAEESTKDINCHLDRTPGHHSGQSGERIGIRNGFLVPVSFPVTLHMGTKQLKTVVQKNLLALSSNCLQRKEHIFIGSMNVCHPLLPVKSKLSQS